MPDLRYAIGEPNAAACMLGCAALAAICLTRKKTASTRVAREWLGLFALTGMGIGAAELARETLGSELLYLALAVIICAAATLLLLAYARHKRRAIDAEDLYRRAMTERPSPVVLIDLDGKCAGVSDSAAQSLGWTEQHCLGRAFADLWPPHLQAVAEDCVQRVLAGSDCRVEIDWSRPDGHPVTWRLDIYGVPGEDGGACLYVADFIDITDLKNAQDAITRKLNEQIMLLDNIETQIWYLADPQTYGAANRAHAQFLGVNKDLLERRNIYDVVGEKAAGVCIDGNQEAFDHKTQVRTELEIQNREGETRWLSVVKTPMLDARGRVMCLVCTAQDVTDHKKTEAGLRMQMSAINAATDQIIITDVRGRIEFANPAFENETGYSFDEIKGKNPRFLKSGKQDTDFYALLWNTILSGRTWHGEVTNNRKDGTPYVAQMMITPVKNEAGVIERFVAINRNITEKKVFEQRMDYLAHHDLLTGLPNRLLIGHRLTQSLSQARRRRNRAAVLFLDLDGFKLINDTLGHKTGDMLLKCVAERLRSCCRDGDTLARMGGDEFVIVLSHVKGADDAAKFARRVLKKFSTALVLDDQEIFVSTSIGIAIYPDHGDDVEALVKNADAAMYRAKEQGTNSYHFYDEALNEAAAERMALENKLRKAVERGEFVVRYQPRVDVASGRILGAEALVRWKHPDLGMMSPDQFIPLAEETGLIISIGEWVLRTACTQNKAWQDAGLPPIEVAVNLSARQLQRRNTLAVLRNALKESGLDPKYLELELTESALMQRPDIAAEVLGKMKSMGVHLSVDDFGTGYSSLSYLKRFPVDALKVDRSFVKDITTNPDDEAITRAVIAMAHSLNLTVVAEGVETLEQLRFLFELGCDEMQGYFVSAAVSAEEFEHLLRASQDEAFNRFDLAA